jgi:heme-degrading monooxygenase HmoA
VPKEVQPLFLANWREREQDMQQHPGFVDFELKQDGDNFVISSR